MSTPLPALLQAVAALGAAWPLVAVVPALASETAIPQTTAAAPDRTAAEPAATEVAAPLALTVGKSTVLRLPAPVNPSSQIGLADAIRVAGQHGGVLPAGTVICEGTVDSGDLVLVDKFSYHFRKPKRGEVFVFDTIGIRGIHDRKGEQAAGSHYIKRLCGVPGDTLGIQPPDLLIDGKIARESGIQRVIRGEGPYSINPNGYVPADPREARAHPRPVSQYLVKPGDTLTLTAQGPPGYREYAALGDNTGNSLDSRYWGPVREFNLVGPALFSLWPVTTGHWGFIR